jgi:hypothetical protein
VSRVGVLSPFDPSDDTFLEVFRQGLRDLIATTGPAGVQAPESIGAASDQRLLDLLRAKTKVDVRRNAAHALLRRLGPNSTGRPSS